jgi:hypothetical protein
MNWHFELFSISRSYCNRVKRAAGIMAVCVPRATTIANMWIHSSKLLEDGGLLDLKPHGLLSSPLLHRQCSSTPFEVWDLVFQNFDLLFLFFSLSRRWRSPLSVKIIFTSSLFFFSSKHICLLFWFHFLLLYFR